MDESKFFLAGLDFIQVTSFSGHIISCAGVRGVRAEWWVQDKRGGRTALWWQGQLTLRVG